MKVIKKCLKVAACFTAFAAAGLSFATSPTVSAFAAVKQETTQADINQISALGIPTSVDATQGQPFALPKLAVAHTIKVYDTADQVHTWNVDAGVANNDAKNTEADCDYFNEDAENVYVNYLNNGEYKVVYIVNGVYSHIYRVQVKNLSYQLSFEDSNGLKQLVKPTVAVSSETTNSKWIKLPTATVSKIVDGEPVEIADKAEVKVSIDGAPATINTSEPEKGTWQTFASIEAAKTGVVAYSTANAQTGKKLHVVEITTGDDAGIYLIPSEEVQFTVKYSYNKGDNRPSVPYTISVVEDFKEPEEFNVKTPELPSFELGDKDIKLNLPTVSNDYQENVAYNITKIRIQHTDNKETIYQELTNNDLTFDMTIDAFSRPGFTVSSYESLTGTYEIIYTIVDAYGNSKEVSYKKDGITISSNPKVYMSYDYTITTDAGVKTATGVETGYAVDLKSEYTYNNIVVPAAYGEDKISSFNDLYIVRTLVNADKTSEVYYIDNVKYSGGKIVPISSTDNGNHSSDVKFYTSEELDEVDVSKAVSFKFSDAEAEDMVGKTFILRYEVRSKNVKTRKGTLVAPETGKEYTFKVVESIEKGKDPTVKITNLSNETAIMSGDTVSVEVSATDGKDSRLATRVYTIDDVISGKTEVANLKKLIQDSVTEVLTKPETSNYAYGKCNVLDYDKFLSGVRATHATFSDALTEDEKDVYSFSATTAKTVVAVTVNDDGTVAIATKVVTIKELDDDQTPSYIVEDAHSFAGDPDDKTKIYDITANVGDTITLPTLVFSDNKDGSLALNVSYYINSPISEDGLNYYYPENCTTYNNRAVGGQIKLTQEGTYTVVYTATDNAGNTNVATFEFVVTEIIKTELEVEITGNKKEGFALTNDGAKANSGAIIKIDASVVNFDEDVYSEVPAVELELINAGLYYEYLGDNQYQFFGAGEYKFRFSAGSDDTASGMQEYIIKIDAVKLAWSENTFGTVPETAELNEVVFLPMPTTNSSAEITAKVTKDGKDVEVTYVNDGWTFVAASEGSYKVQYIAKNANYVLEDNSSKFTINVGDNVKPKLTVSQQTTLEQDIIYDGTNNIEYKVSIDTSKKKVYIDVISNGEKLIDHLDIGLSVTDKNDAGDLDNNTSALWRTVDAEFAESSIIESGEDYQWFITGTGKCTLTITAKDKNNVGEVQIVFNVVRKTEAENKNDTAVGIALIVVSLVVLAGVIAYFAFAGKKGGSLKRKNKVSEVEVKDETVEVEDTKVEEAKVEETKAEEVEQETEVKEEVETVEETVEAEPTQEVEEVKAEEKTEETNSTDAE